MRHFTIARSNWYRGHGWSYFIVGTSQGPQLRNCFGFMANQLLGLSQDQLYPLRTPKDHLAQAITIKEDAAIREGWKGILELHGALLTPKGAAIQEINDRENWSEEEQEKALIKEFASIEIAVTIKD